MQRYQRKLIVAAIAIPVLVGLAIYTKSHSRDRVKSETYALIQELPSYEQEKQYLDSLFAASYDAAFEAAYEHGGRRKAADFDTQKYVTTIFDSMIAKAQTDGKKNLADELKAIKIMLQSTIEKRNPD